MYDPALPSLAEWETFCVIIGSSAAALTGLMFVVVALRSDVKIGGTTEISAFVTPSVIHFCSVLLVIALLCMPRQTVWSLFVCLAAIGLFGIGLAFWALTKIRKQQNYKMVMEDWIFHVVLPFVSYAALLASAFVLWHSVERALYAIASSTLLLLFIGIHNAWDAAVFISMMRRAPEKKD